MLLVWGPHFLDCCWSSGFQPEIAMSRDNFGCHNCCVMTCNAPDSTPQQRIILLQMSIVQKHFRERIQEPDVGEWVREILEK